MEKLIFILFISIFSSQLFAKACDQQFENYEQYKNLDSAILKVVKKIEKPWEAATDEQIRNAKCRKPVLSSNEMISILKDENKLTTPIQLGGRNFKGMNPELVSSLKKLVNKKGNSLDEEESDVFDFTAADFKDCQDTICLSKKVFGDELGPKLLFLVHKYGLNGSDIVHKQTRRWGAEEIDDIIMGLNDMPSYFFPMSHNKKCVHDEKDGGKTMANASITFFGGVDNLSKEGKNYTTFHELSHYISGELEIDHSEEWKKLSGWRTDLKKKYLIEESFRKSDKEKKEKEKTNKLFNETINLDFDLSFQPKSPTNQVSFSSISSSGFNMGYPTENPYAINTGFDDFVDKMKDKTMDILIFYEASVSDNPEKIISKYGESNPSEDFAESMTAYRYNPKKLKEISPEKYEFIKNKVFGGLEFDKTKNCRDKKSSIFNHLMALDKWESNNQDLISNIPRDIDDNECFSLSSNECNKKRKRRYTKQKYVESLNLSQDQQQDLITLLQAYSQ